jgi:hypothetical protein
MNLNITSYKTEHLFLNLFLDAKKAAYSNTALEQFPFGIRKQQNKCGKHFTCFTLCNFNAFNSAYITKSTKIGVALSNCKEQQHDVIIL